jgi:Family of unknown function (DUF5681)
MVMARNRPGAGDSYEVGYKKPPKSHRFQPGQSGNPKGRPSGTKNLRTDLMEELGERILVREGERQIRVSKQRALIKSQVNRGIKGDNRAADKVFDLYLKLKNLEDEAAEAGLPLSSEEQEVLRNLEARILRRARSNPDIRKTKEKRL